MNFEFIFGSQLNVSVNEPHIERLSEDRGLVGRSREARALSDGAMTAAEHWDPDLSTTLPTCTAVKDAVKLVEDWGEFGCEVLQETPKERHPIRQAARQKQR